MTEFLGEEKLFIFFGEFSKNNKIFLEVTS